MGRQNDDISGALISLEKKGIKLIEDVEPSFMKPSKVFDKKTGTIQKGTIRYSQADDYIHPTKKFALTEEFLHSIVEYNRNKFNRFVRPEMDRMITANQVAAKNSTALPYTDEAINALKPRMLRQIDNNAKQIERNARGRGVESKVAGEEVFVKQWMLKHSRISGVGESERELLEMQIYRLQTYGLSKGY